MGNRPLHFPAVLPEVNVYFTKDEVCVATAAKALSQDDVGKARSTAHEGIADPTIQVHR